MITNSLQKKPSQLDIQSRQQENDSMSNSSPNSDCHLDKIESFIIKSYGLREASQMKLESKTRKDLMQSILIKELNKTYKYPEAVSSIPLSPFFQAYQALDFTGKGYVDVNDMVDLKIMYKLPFSKEVSSPFSLKYNHLNRNSEPFYQKKPYSRKCLI